MVFKRLGSDINILPILKQVAENWNDFYISTIKQNKYKAVRETMSINLIKGVPLPDDFLYDNSQETMKTELYYKYDECVYFLNWFEKTYSGKIRRAHIAHLKVNGKVYPHIDGGEYFKNKDRFHLGLSGYYDYTVEDETQRFGAGDLFWFNNKKMHSCINATPIPRISLIFDAEGCTI